MPPSAPTPPPRRPAPGPPPAHPTLATATEIAAWLTAAKCDDVAALDVAPACAFADAFVLATARSARHASMAADAVAHALKERATEGGHPTPPPVEGAPGDDWLLVDGGRVLAHVFVADARDRYGLDRLWGKGGEAEEGRVGE